jgi:hypothetical protein
MIDAANGERYAVLLVIFLRVCFKLSFLDGHSGNI